MASRRGRYLRLRFRTCIARRASLLIGMAICLTSSGCAIDIFGWFRRPEPVPIVFERPPTKSELVNKINERSRKLIGWRSNDVSISTTTPQGIPVSASAVMAVQAPRNFRMIVSMFSINQADFGSNADRFWIWMRDSTPKNVFIAKHEDFPLLQRKMPIPIQPEWLMETLGVMQMDERMVNLYYEDRDGHKAVLSSRQTLPDGRTVIQVVRVNSQTAQINERILQNGAGEIIARAEFKDHKPIEKSNIWMPHRIDLHLPKTKSVMTLTMGTIEVNPIIPDHLWEVPKYNGSPPMDLSAILRRQDCFAVPRPGISPQHAGSNRPHFEDENLQPAPINVQSPSGTPEVSSTPPPFPGGSPGRVTIGASSPGDVAGLGRPQFDDE